VVVAVTRAQSGVERQCDQVAPVINIGLLLNKPASIITINTNQSIIQSTNQSLDQPINQSFIQSINHSINQSKSIYQSTSINQHQCHE